MACCHSVLRRYLGCLQKEKRLFMGRHTCRSLTTLAHPASTLVALIKTLCYTWRKVNVWSNIDELLFSYDCRPHPLSLGIHLQKYPVPPGNLGNWNSPKTHFCFVIFCCVGRWWCDMCDAGWCGVWEGGRQRLGGVRYAAIWCRTTDES